jgi:hypothetical protein
MLTHPATEWCQSFNRLPLAAEIHPFEGCPQPCGNGECVGLYYQALVEPRTAARAITEAMRFCTGISSGRELTAT